MANPRVRPHLRFYPEDAGKKVNEYWQARHWLHEVDPARLSPMAVIGDKHVYVDEPCLLRNGEACMPIKWFSRDGSLVAKAHRLQARNRELVSGWVVEEYNEIEVPGSEFFIGFKDWDSANSTNSLPAATSIFGFFFLRSMIKVINWGTGSLSEPSGELIPWTRTDPLVGNRWRSISGGSRVYAFPIWLYCDDTSGNLSKKWNKHNSFLFTPAGLPRAQVHLEYNVHFLCTSNIAPPLEMLDGIVDQFE